MGCDVVRVEGGRGGSVGVHVYVVEGERGGLS